MIYGEIKNNHNEDISILITVDNHTGKYLCDCGFASKLSIKEIKDIVAIFISHTHIDHFVNFDNILRNQIGSYKKVIICGPKGISKNVQSKALSYTWNLIKEDEENIQYEIREIIDNNNILISEIKPPNWELKFKGKYEDKYIYNNDRFVVKYTSLNHGIPSIAYLFEEYPKMKIDISKTEFTPGPWIRVLKEYFKNKKSEKYIDINGIKYKAGELFNLLTEIKGYKLGVIMDHNGDEENHKKIYEVFHEADTVFIESFYKEDDSELAQINNHSTSIKSGEIMRKTKVKKAVPVHFSRRYTKEEVEEVINEFNKSFKNNL